MVSFLSLGADMNRSGDKRMFRLLRANFSIVMLLNASVPLENSVSLNP